MGYRAGEVAARRRNQCEHELIHIYRSLIDL